MRSLDRGTVVRGGLTLLWLAAGCAPTTATCGVGFTLQADGRCVANEDAGGGADAGPSPDGGPDGGSDAATARDAGGGTDASTLLDSGQGRDAFVAPVDAGTDAFVDPIDMGTDACVLTTYYQDGDGDGHGNLASSTQACSMPGGYVTSSDDCDDTTGTRHPGLAETCDAVDNDCDATVDDGFPCVQGAASVACTTSCGSTGTGSCTASCALPTGAACTPPIETCNNVDDDCDGLIDDGVRRFGPRRDLGAGTSGIVALPTSTGYVVVYNTGSGIRARRLDATGALVGAEANLVGSSVFSATVSGNNLVLAYMVGSALTAAVYDASTLATLTAATTITTATGTTEIRVVATATSASFVTTDGIAVSFTSRSIPTLAGTGGLVSIDGNMRGDFDAVAQGTHAYVAFVDTTYNVEVRGFTIGGPVDGAITATLASGGAPYRRPAVHVASVAGTSRLGVTWEHNGGTPSTQHYYFATFDVSGTGTLTAHTTASAVLMGINAVTPTSAGESRALDLTYTNARWVVSYLSGTSSSTWSIVEVQEVSGGISASTAVQVETTGTDNRGVAMAPGTGAQLLVSASQTAAAARAYLWACGS